MSAQKKTHQDWMAEALECAKKALPKDVPVGAIVVYDGQIIAEGWNTRELDNSPTGHAEIMAIEAAANALDNWRLSDCTLYVTLEPCPMCAAALQQARVSKIVYGVDDIQMGACGSKTNVFSGDKKTEILGGILEDDCRTLMNDFFKTLRQ